MKTICATRDDTTDSTGVSCADDSGQQITRYDYLKKFKSSIFILNMN